jgi:phage gpG-like protein
MQLRFTIDDSRMKRKFAALTAIQRSDVLIRALKAGGVVVLNEARINILAQHLWKTRTLSRSLHQEVIEQSATRAKISVGTDLEYAAIHEFGGVVTPKHAKYLAIPVNGATGSPLDRDDLHPVLSGSGSLVLVDETGVQFILKDSVTIPAQPYLRPAVDEHVEQIVEEIKVVLKQQIEVAWKTA